MSVNAQQELLARVSLVLAPLRAAAQSEAHLRDFVGMIGWDLDRITGLPVDELSDRLRALVGATDELIAHVEHPPETLLDVLRSLDAARRAFDAIRELPSIFAAGRGPTHFEEFGRDLVAVATTSYLQLSHPALYHLAVLLTLIEPAGVDGPTPAVFDAQGKLVRFPTANPRLRLGRLGGLVEDPAATLRSEYVGANGLVTVADAQHTAAKLFPRIAALLSALGIDAVYGTKSVYGIDVGDPHALTAGTMTCWITPVTSELSFGATLSLSPKERGDLGLVISPFGDAQLTGSSGAWDLAAELAAGFEAVAVGPHGVTLQAAPGSGATHFVAHASARRRPPSGGGAVLVGSSTGSRLELAGVGLTGAVILSETERRFAVELEVTSATLVLSPGDGDGFLGEILPPDGLRADFDLAVGWSNATGLTFRGSAGLDAQIPVNASDGPLSVESAQLGIRAAGAGIKILVTATAGVRLGPVDAVVTRAGVQASIAFDGDGNLGVADVALGFKPPDGIGLVIDAGPVSGGGFLGFDAEKGLYSGGMQLEFEGIAVRAVGLLSTRLPGGRDGFSLLVVVSAEFPPVQLGLGFMLVGVGGLLGVNRTVAVEALRAGLKTGALGAVLSPPDPVANVGQLVAGLEGLFPPAAGRYVFGPTARIVWGSPTLITIDLCLVLELPAPVRLVVLGRLRAVLPDEREAIVRLQMDVLGVVDFDRGEAAVDATLVDSRLAGFALTGDMALRMSWGSRPSFLLAVGGFHPRFAAPPGFPVLERVAVALATGENPKLRLEAYLALTSNTVQFGARVDLAARAGRFSVAGFLSFDALLTVAPLAFTVDIAAKLAVKVGGHTILSVSLQLTLSGPGQWHARGRASFSILFFDVSFGFDVTIGDKVLLGALGAVDVAALLVAALADTRSWSVRLPVGGASFVTLRAIDVGAEVLAHPIGTLEVRQRVAPFERTLERFGSAVPSGARRFRIAAATIGPAAASTAGGPAAVAGLQDLFAPGQFRALSDEQKLSLASFEAMPSGAVIGAHDVAHGAPVSVGVVYEQQLITATGAPGPTSQHIPMPADILTLLTTPPPTTNQPTITLTGTA